MTNEFKECICMNCKRKFTPHKWIRENGIEYTDKNFCPEHSIEAQLKEAEEFMKKIRRRKHGRQ